MKSKQITKKQCDEFLATIAEVKPWDAGNGEMIDAWYSKVDGSYITFTNISTDISWMIANGITEQIQSNEPEDAKVACIGFNPIEQKWYGWSHRAFFGFGIGSEVKKGHCGYVSTDINDLIERSIQFWSDETVKNVAGIAATNDKGIEGVQITYEYVTEKVPNESLHGQIGEQFMYPPKKWGRGEWKAETLEDAKQMAIDFAHGVS